MKVPFQGHQDIDDLVGGFFGKLSSNRVIVEAFLKIDSGFQSIESDLEIEELLERTSNAIPVIKLIPGPNTTQGQPLAGMVILYC